MPPTGKQLKRCQFCWKAFATQRAVNQHISASIICLKEWQKDIVKDNNRSRKRRRINSPESSSLDDSDLPHDNPDLPNDEPMDYWGDDNNQGNVEDADDRLGDEDNLASPKRYVEPFPEPAGVALRREKTRFENLLERQQLEEKAPWEPFASRTEWELVEWLMKNVGQKSIDEYLKLPIVSRTFCPS
jgi:hypothetical protein